MGLSGFVGGGAQDALARLLAQDLLREQQERQAAQQAAALNERQADRVEDTRRFEVTRGDQQRQLAATLARQTAQDEAAAGEKRAARNDRGVLDMAAEGVDSGAINPRDPAGQRTLAAMLMRAGEAPKMPDLSGPTPEEEDTRALGNLRKQLELRKQFETPPQSETQWVTRNGKPMEVPKGRSQPGDVPYDRTPSQPPKMPAAMANRLADTETVLGTIGKLETAYKDDFVGPVAGRYNRMERGAPGVVGSLMRDAPQGFEEFNALTATLKNDLIRAITGAAVGVQEQQRIMGQIPDLTDTPQNWRAKLAITKDNLKRLQAAIARAGGAADVPLTDVQVDVPGMGGGGNARPRLRFDAQGRPIS